MHQLTTEQILEMIQDLIYYRYNSENRNIDNSGSCSPDYYTYVRASLQKQHQEYLAMFDQITELLDK